MSRPLRRCSLTVAAVAAALLAGPAAAQAATYTVSAGGGSCGGMDLACGGLAEASVAAGVGDIFNVAPGTYTGATFNVGGVTINGAPGVVINGTMQFSADIGGTSTLTKITAVNSVAGPPAILAVGDAGLVLSDAVVVSINSDGVVVGEGTTNKIVRSVIVTGAPTRAAVRATSIDSSTANKALTIESTLLSGGAAGLSVNTGSAGIASTAGDVDVTLRHVTAAGSTNGLVLDASEAVTLLGGPFGNITATVSDSIIQNGTVKDTYGGVPIVAPPNTVTDTYLRTLPVSQADSNAVFADPSGRDFRLRPDSPAIGAGAFTPGESPTDIDGQDRSAAPTDLGFDEFVNSAPVAKIAVKTSQPRDGQPTQFDASGSTDREARYGGGIVSYQWDFGDGSKQTTTTPTVSHTYKGEGLVTASLTVVDRQNAVSPAASTQLRVLDGGSPVVTITTPKKNKKINVITKKTKTVTKNGVKTKVTTSKRTRIKFAGKAADKSGVEGVFITVEKISTPASGPVAQGRQSTSTKKCTWLDPKKGLRKTSCAKPINIRVKLSKSGTWAYTVRSSIKLSKGGYRVIAVGVDKAGNVGNAAAKSLRNIQFKLK